MPRPTDQRTRVLGPTWIPSRERWRIVVITPEAARPEDRRTTSLYREEDEAREVADALRLRLENVSMERAIDQYEKHLADTSRKETVRRLRLFFPDLGMLVGRITPERARAYYDKFRARKRPDGEPISVAYQRAALINARSLMAWAVEQRWIASNPFATVKGVGRRNAGKLQHTADESRKLGAYCISRAEVGDEAALGVLMAFSMALRSSDLTKRKVRDVDLDGTQLRVEDGKTEASNRPRRIPVELQPLVRRLVADRSPFEPLFPRRVKGQLLHHTRRWLEEAMLRFCKAAGVPYVCPHALKGTAGNLLAAGGEAADKIMEHLSHAKLSTTTRHYISGGAMETAQAGRVFGVIAGGKR